MRISVRRLVLPLLAALLFAPAADAAVTLGVRGDAARFKRMTGQKSTVKYVTVGWGADTKHLDHVFEKFRPVPMYFLPTRDKYAREVITPRQIARGRGDRYLARFNRAGARFGKRWYIRPMAEMNGHWHHYCAYNANGTRRGPQYRQSAFRDAFRRIYVILHGGSRASMNAKLARFDLPRIKMSLPSNPKLRVIWNPQGTGSPNVPGNMPAAYWPGTNFVDVVGNDLYNINRRANWEAADNLYDRFRNEPYAFPEWGLWGHDDPGFVREMRHFVGTHRRVELLVYYNHDPGSPWDLKSKPASRRAYRRLITPLGR
jgi:hypothetical protein